MEHIKMCRQHIVRPSIDPCGTPEEFTSSERTTEKLVSQRKE